MWNVFYGWVVRGNLPNKPMFRLGCKPYSEPFPHLCNEDIELKLKDKELKEKDNEISKLK